MKNLPDSVTDNIDELFESQDSYFRPQISNYAISDQAGNMVSYTKTGNDGLPMDIHFNISNVDVDAKDLADIFQTFKCL